MKSKKNLIIIALVMIIGLFGISYAYFRYYMLGNNNHKIVSGDVSLVLNDGTNSINLTNVFPETIEEARREGRTDNILTFTVSGINTTTNNDIYYEIMLNEGDSEEGKTRYKPEDLLFDLIEVGENNTETYLVEAMNFNDFNARRIWVDSVERNNSLTVNKTYKLRMWLREDVLISDTDPNADYKASVFKNSYGSIKVSVHGDFNRKTSPYNYMMARFNKLDFDSGEVEYLWPTELEEAIPQFTEVRFMSMDRSLLDLIIEEGAIDLTDTTKSPAGSVIAAPLPDSTGEGMALAIMSDGITMLPENSMGLFLNFYVSKQMYFNNINTKNVTNMGYMFWNCMFLENLNLSNFNTGNVTSMTGMFSGCQNINSLNVENFDTNKVTDMSGMFAGCGIRSLNLNKWDTNKVTNMASMFEFCENLNNLQINKWDTSEVENLDKMFYTCSSLTNLDLSDWDTGNVINMNHVFNCCGMLKELDLSAWTTENVTDMGDMFGYCTNLTLLNICGFTFDSVTSYYEIFDNMKDRVDNTPTIIVKSEKEQNWILSLGGNRPSSWTTENVIVK